MRKLIAVVCLVLFAACADDPKPKAVAPENNTSNNPTNNAQNNTGSGGKKIDIYRWILRDKDGEIVNAMVLPYYDPAVTDILNITGDQDIDYSKPPLQLYTGVNISSVEGRLLNHGFYNLKTGMPAGFECSFVYSDNECTMAFLSKPTPVCVDTGNKLVSGGGARAIKVGDDIFVKNADNCIKITSSTQLKQYSPRAVSEVPSNILNLLDNPPYSLSYEKE